MKNKNYIYLPNMWHFLICAPCRNKIAIFYGPSEPIKMTILQKTALILVEKWISKKFEMSKIVLVTY